MLWFILVFWRVLIHQTWVSQVLSLAVKGRSVSRVVSKGTWTSEDMRRSGWGWSGVPIVVVGLEEESGKMVSSWVWTGEDGGMVKPLVVPPFCGLVASSMTVVDWGWIGGSSIIWMMMGVDGEVKEVGVLV
jgi:hypothetical protein